MKSMELISNIWKGHTSDEFLRKKGILHLKTENGVRIPGLL